MHYIIVDVAEKTASALCENGELRMVKNKGLRLGQVIHEENLFFVRWQWFIKSGWTLLLLTLLVTFFLVHN